MEATPPISTPVANDPREAATKAKQSRIPSVQSMSFRKATETTKNIVITQDGRMCWLCCIEWSSNLDVAHNIDASVPLEWLEIWKGLGVLPELFYPTHVDNLILLCKNCHSAYDCNYPAWVMLPQNLDIFINFENNDYAARIAAAKRGVRQSRTMPQVDRKGMLCQPYVLEPSFMNKRSLDWAQFPKHFVGCPQTLILKALAACLYPGQSVEKCDSHGNVVHTGIPAIVIDKVHKLVGLWNQSDPEVVTLQSGQKRQRDDAQDDENDEKDSGEDPEGKDSKNLLNAHSHHSGGNRGRGRGSHATKDKPPRGAGRDSRSSAESKNKRTNAKQRVTTCEVPTILESSPTTNQFPHHNEQADHSNNGTVDQTTEFPVSPLSSVKPRNTCHRSTEFGLAKGLKNGRSYESLDGNEMRYGEEQFVLGPEKTAADIMSMADGWRRVRELDKAAWKARVQNARNKKVEAQ